MRRARWLSHDSGPGVSGRRPGIAGNVGCPHHEVVAAERKIRVGEPGRGARGKGLIVEPTLESRLARNGRIGEARRVQVGDGRGTQENHRLHRRQHVERRGGRVIGGLTLAELGRGIEGRGQCLSGPVAVYESGDRSGRRFIAADGAQVAGHDSHEAAAATINALAEQGIPRRVRAMFDNFGIRYAPGMKCEPYEGRSNFGAREEELDIDPAVLRPAARKSFERTRPGSGSPYFPFGWADRLRNPGPILTAERCQELRQAAERLATETEHEIERLEQGGAA